MKRTTTPFPDPDDEPDRDALAGLSDALRKRGVHEAEIDFTAAGRALTAMMGIRRDNAVRAAAGHPPLPVRLAPDESAAICDVIAAMSMLLAAGGRSRPRKEEGDQ